MNMGLLWMNYERETHFQEKNTALENRLIFQDPANLKKKAILLKSN